MSGENSLFRYEASLGLPEFGFANETRASDLIQLSESKLAKLTPSECAEGAYILEQFALYIQRAINRENAALLKLESELNSVIYSRPLKANGGSVEERRWYVIATDQNARELQNSITETKQKIETISHLSLKLERLSDRMDRMAYARRNQE